MSITDELREFIEDKTWMANNYAKALAIADRIDERHKHAIGYVDDRDPETMAENGWVRLPKDADGEYVNVGDWIINPDISNRKHKVDAITPESVYWWGEDGCHWRYSHLVRHYHEPTVEDVLREFAMRTDEIPNDASGIEPFKALVADFAKRLKLAEGEDA